MSDHDQRALKQRKTRGPPFLQELPSTEVDEASSTTSSSSSEVLLPVRSQTKIPSTIVELARGHVSADYEGHEEEGGGEGGGRRDDDDTTSSDPGDSDDESSIEESSDDEDEEDNGTQGEQSRRLLRTSGSAPDFSQPSDIRSRLQDFLPRLEQANAELGQGEGQNQIFDQVSDEDEQYIEMDLSLGILAERDNKDATVKIPQVENDQEHDDEALDMTLSTTKDARKPTKRKIEELG